MKVYKIRNKETGLFKQGGGGRFQYWTKTGKSWSSIGALKNHIRMEFWDKKKWGKDELIAIYLNAHPTHEILEITIEETNIKVLNIKVLI